MGQRMTSKEDVKHLCLCLQQVPPVHLWQKCCCRDKTTGTYKQSVPNHCHKLHWGLIECCLVCEAVMLRFATFPVINKSLQTHWTGQLCRLLTVKLMKNSRKLTWSCPYQRSGMETIVDPELQAVLTMKRMDGQTQSSNLLWRHKTLLDIQWQSRNSRCTPLQRITLDCPKGYETWNSSPDPQESSRNSQMQTKSQRGTILAWNVPRCWANGLQ